MGEVRSARKRPNSHSIDHAGVERMRVSDSSAQKLRDHLVLQDLLQGLPATDEMEGAVTAHDDLGRLGE